MIPPRVTKLVTEAINYAKAKHPSCTIDCQPNRDTRLRILAEEVGEVAAECQDVEGNLAARRRLAHELAQVIACTTLWLTDELRTIDALALERGEGGA